MELGFGACRLGCGDPGRGELFRRARHFPAEGTQLLSDALIEHLSLLEYPPRLGNRYHEGDGPAAARADDLRGIPATYLDVGSAETFRDEVVNLACRLWAAEAMPSYTCGPVGSMRSTSTYPRRGFPRRHAWRG